MEKIRLDIIGMSYSQSQSGAYALILGEHEETRIKPPGYIELPDLVFLE